MLVPALLVAGVDGLAYAELPQPPMDDAAKAMTAAAAKKGAEDLAKAMDRVAECHR